ncbi:MAG: WhiB family transcriptional regulator [Rhodococcus sp. (in: high G+C Gram-positive bacteria)]|nr:WhiB family transcriptional regulator [Rhodococcus sp. (in: high G+C Gram-positive bacteria)]
MYRPPVQLPLPHADEWDWQRRGACRTEPSGIFFPAGDLRGSALGIVERSAKRVCALCPVIEECLRHALDCREPYGIWGGLTALERSKQLDGSRVADPPPSTPTHRIGPPLRHYKKRSRV